MMQATSVQPPKTVRIIPATIDTKAAITQNYRQLRVAAYCRVSSTVSISGSSSTEFYLDFLIQFLSTFRPEGFYSLFCGPVFEPLTWSCQATAPHGHPACGPGPCASPATFSAACGRSGYRRVGRDFGAELPRKIRLMWWSNRVTASIAAGGRISSKWFRRYCAFRCGKYRW